MLLQYILNRFFMQQRKKCLINTHITAKRKNALLVRMLEMQFHKTSCSIAEKIIQI